jgi:CheY-like chemotaxis protein
MSLWSSLSEILGLTPLAKNPTPDKARLQLNANVLMVEDNEVNRLILGEMLEHLHCTVDVACNGREALAEIERQRYDLILMDVQMPVMDGLEATRRLRALQPPVAAPIVALTANAFADDRARCQAAGMSDFIAKPFEIDALFTTLLKWLRPPG